MPPDFLNSREDAILLWGGAILAFVFWKDARGIGSAFWGVLRSLAQPKLLGLYAATLTYAALLVYAAWRLDVWHAPALKETIYWFLGTAVVLVGGAITTGVGNPQAFLRGVFRRVVAVTVIVEFIANVYALPLAFEIVGVFLVIAFSGMQPLVERDPSVEPSARKFIAGVPIAVGFVYLVYFLVRVLGDFDSFATRENAEDFLVGPLLTLALIPFLIAAARFSGWEQERIRRRFRSKHAA